MKNVRACSLLCLQIQIKHLSDNVIITRDFIGTIEKICIHLVHMDKCESAVTIYEEFVDPEKDQNYGFFVLREMLHCDVVSI